MIKVIAFDLVGVLVRENDYVLNEIESKVERLFGPNKSDEEFISCVKETILNDTTDEIIKITKHIISSIYDKKINLEDLKTIKNNYPNVKFVVATNHVSWINEYIQNTFNNIFDEIFISANMHEIKPEKEFYTKILQDMNIHPNELLFLDDSLKNIQGANDCDIHTIHVTKDTNILNRIASYL